MPCDTINKSIASYSLSVVYILTLLIALILPQNIFKYSQRTIDISAMNFTDFIRMIIFDEYKKIKITRLSVTSHCIFPNHFLIIFYKSLFYFHYKTGMNKKTDKYEKNIF